MKLTWREKAMNLRLTHTFDGTKYIFTYPVSRKWALWYIRNQEGITPIAKEKKVR